MRSGNAPSEPTYELLPIDHDSVKHSLGETVKGDVHANAVVSLCNELSQCAFVAAAWLQPHGEQLAFDHGFGIGSEQILEVLRQMRVLLGGRRTGFCGLQSCLACVTERG